MVKGFRKRTVLPGFGITLGYTITYLSLIVLIPLFALFLRASSLSLAEFWRITTAPNVLATYRVTFGSSLISALINVPFGFIVAWCLVRYRFPGRQLLDAIVDLPFALPTAVSGIALTTIYTKNGWLGQYLEPLGIKVAFTQAGIVIAMIFIGLPFVVRTLQPALEELDGESEEAAASLGATRWQTFYRVVFPSILPALITGFALAFSRALGEFGSVVFISGNIPMRTEITSWQIATKLEQFDYSGAAAIAVVMLVLSFSIMLAINTLQWYVQSRPTRGL